MKIGDLVTYHFAKRKYTGIVLKIEDPDERYYSGVTRLPKFVIALLEFNGKVYRYDVWEVDEVEIHDKCDEIAKTR